MYYFHKKNERGFTLTELLVVIAIIGILSSVVLASLSNARVKGRDAKRTSDIKQIQLALEFYYDANGNAYPANLSALTPTFIGSLPVDPDSPSQDYTYATNSGDTPPNTTYALRAQMEQDEDVLEDDLDGTQQGLDCNDTSPNFYFCVGP